jgi:hypothetical protein
VDASAPDLRRGHDRPPHLVARPSARPGAATRAARRRPAPVRVVRRTAVILQALLWSGVAVASFAAAGALVLAIVVVNERYGGRLPGRGEPSWWPEFERAFADYVRAGDGPPS